MKRPLCGLLLLALASWCQAEPLPDAAAGGYKFHAAPKPLPTGAKVEAWPRLLGPTHQAGTGETKLLHTFPPGGPKLLWEYAKGVGFGGPVVGEGKVVLFHRIGTQEVVDCLEAETGKRLWRHAYEAPYQDRYGAGDGPRNSPVLGEGCVYTYGISGQLHCLELASGKVRWQRDCAEADGLRQNFFGHGSTPLLHAGRLIINLGGENDLCLAAFDPATGKVLWQTRHPWGASYASPVPARLQGKECVLVFAGGESRPPIGGLLCVEEATGKILAEVPYRAEIPESVNAASPLVVGEGVFLTEAYGAGGAFISLADFAQAGVKWRAESFNSQFITPVLQAGVIYGAVSGNPANAELVALEAESGKELWRDDLGGKMGRISLLQVDGAFLGLGEFGSLLWLELTRSGAKILQQAKLFHAPETWTLPAVSQGLLYVCQNNPAPARGGAQPARLLCYDFRGE